VIQLADTIPATELIFAPNRKVVNSEIRTAESPTVLENTHRVMKQQPLTINPALFIFTLFIILFSFIFLNGMVLNLVNLLASGSQTA
jgi:hypothetical protein